MLKQSITYTDFNDDTCTDTLYFNITKSELYDNLHLEQELESIRKTFEGDKRDLGAEEIKSILNLVKTFMRLSYGIRSEDGKRFAKTPELWTEFTQTAAYDAFILSLFENPENAVNFMTAIIPADLRDQAMAQLEKDKGKNAAMRAIREQAVKAEAGQAAKDAEPTANARAIDEVHPILGSHIQSTPDVAVVPSQPSQAELDSFRQWQAENATKA